MEGLVNYSSEDEQDDYPYKKVAVRERTSGSAVCSGRATTEVTAAVKRPTEQTKTNSCESETSYRKGRDSGKESFKSGSSGYNEDKYKYDRKTESSRDHKEKRDAKDSKYSRDARDDDREYDGKKYDHKKVDDHKLYREHKKEYKRDSIDYNRDEKRYNRYDDRKASNTANNKDRLNSSRSRVDERKHYDDRYNEERRRGNATGSSFTDDRRKEHNDRRNHNHDDDRRIDRRSDDRRTQRSYNDDRTYRSRRSASPTPTHNSKGNKYSDRKEENSTRRERKRHSRSRSRSRSRSNSPEKPTESLLTKSSNQRIAHAEQPGNLKRPEEESSNCEKKVLPTARNFEALLALPLSENAPKHTNIVTVPATSVASTPTPPAVQLPSYYNPNVINPNKYVEQMQKRKLIWGAKKVEDSASKWGHAQFSQDQDGKVASKFMRLMGIKNATSSVGESSTSPNDKNDKKSPSATSPPNTTDVKSREAMFTTMEHQYEVARQVTHTMRGVGLGFSSQPRPY